MIRSMAFIVLLVQIQLLIVNLNWAQSFPQKNDTTSISKFDKVKILTFENFSKEVHARNSTQLTWLIQFYNSSRNDSISPILEEISNDYAKNGPEPVYIGVADCHVKNHFSLCDVFRIQELPAFRAFTDTKPFYAFGILLNSNPSDTAAFKAEFKSAVFDKRAIYGYVMELIYEMYGCFIQARENLTTTTSDNS